jgi:hypothetical protein
MICASIDTLCKSSQKNGIAKHYACKIYYFSRKINPRNEYLPEKMKDDEELQLSKQKNPDVQQLSIGIIFVG